MPVDGLWTLAKPPPGDQARFPRSSSSARREPSRRRRRDRLRPFRPFRPSFSFLARACLSRGLRNRADPPDPCSRAGPRGPDGLDALELALLLDLHGGAVASAPRPLAEVGRRTGNSARGSRTRPRRPVPGRQRSASHPRAPTAANGVSLRRQHRSCLSVCWRACSRRSGCDPPVSPITPARRGPDRRPTRIGNATTPDGAQRCGGPGG